MKAERTHQKTKHIPHKHAVAKGAQDTPFALRLFSSATLLRFDAGLLAVCAVFLALLPLSTPRIYATDEVQYYVYIRSLYFDGDLDFLNEYRHFAEVGLHNDDPAIYNALLRDNPADPPIHPQTGKVRNVAPIGASLLWSPGFIATDLVVRCANLLGAAIPTDGYAKPYIWAVCWMSAFYALAGLVLTYLLARRFSGPFAAAVATIVVFLATPLVFYTYIAMPWAHAAAFFLFALFLTIWLRNWEKPLAERLARRSVYEWALLGLVGGLMAITREQLGLMLLLPALEGLLAYISHIRYWSVERHPVGSTGRQAFFQVLTGHLVFCLFLALALAPQLLTYQILNGSPLPSSTVTGKLGSSGGFSPHFFDTLIHPRHGAFLWSPVLPIGLLGLFWLGRRDWLLATLLGVGFLAQTYINGSFGTTWHLSRAFGFRRLIECTPIFVLGLAMIVGWLQMRGSWPPIVLAALFFVYWNVGIVAQWTIVRPDMREGLIWDGMLYYQFVEVPKQVVGQLGNLLFDRCRMMQNC